MASDVMFKLIPNWQRAHRMISVQLCALAGAINGIWPTIPQDLKDALPHNLVHYVSIALLVAAVAGRLIDQGSVTETKDTP